MTTSSSTPTQAPTTPSTGRLTARRPYTDFPLLRKETLHPGDASRNLFPIVRLTFGYAENESLPINFATDAIKVVHPSTGSAKSYSPTSDPSRVGEFDLVVKVYPAPGVSAYLASVPVGGRVAMYGPHPPPPARPAFRRDGARRIIAVALGVGITHAYTTLRAVLAESAGPASPSGASGPPSPPPGQRVTLVVGVQYAEQAGVLAQEIAQLERDHPGRFDIVRVASRDKADGFRSGRVDSALIKELVGCTPFDEVRIMVTGTKKMIKAVWADLGSIGLSYEHHALVKKLHPLTMLYNFVTGTVPE